MGDLSPGRHLTTSGDIFGCHNWEDATSIKWIEARGAAKHPIIHGIASHNK